MTGEWVVYRLFDDDGRLLYIGSTGRLGYRLEQHARSKSWWDEVATRETVAYPDEASVRAAEREAILQEQPRHNIMHTEWQDDHVRKPVVPTPLCGTRAGDARHRERGETCQPCRDAASDQYRKNLDEALTFRDSLTHGLPGTYANGCRCEQCRQAHTDYRRERKAADHAYAAEVFARLHASEQSA